MSARVVVWRGQIQRIAVSHGGVSDRICKLLKGKVLANMHRHNFGNIYPIYCIY